MELDFWHARWEAGQIGFHQDEVNRHLTEFWPKLDCAKGSKVFVPLAGKSLDILWLLGEGYKVVANELSETAVKAFFSENKLEATQSTDGEFEKWEMEDLTFYQGDFFDLDPEHLSDIHAVYDRASLIALPPEMRTVYASHLVDILPLGTKTLLVTLDYDQEEMSGPPFSVSAQEVDTLFSSSLSITGLYEANSLAESPQFQKAGVTQMWEKVFLME